MHFAPNTVPAEKQQRKKTRLQKKRKNALRRQRAPKDVSHIARIGRPVGPKLKLHHDSGRNADGKCQREHLGPKPRHLVVDRLVGLEPQSLHDHQHDSQSDAQGRVNIMERYRQGKLYPGKNQYVHNLRTLVASKRDTVKGIDYRNLLPQRQPPSDDDGQEQHCSRSQTGDAILERFCRQMHHHQSKYHTANITADVRHYVASG